MTPRIALGLSLLSLVVFVGVNTFLLLKPEPIPKIRGVVVPEGRDIDSFSLVDHLGQRFDNRALKGRWSLLSYGFTDCPDICPTTLNKLVAVKKRLHEEGRFHDDLQVLFYTVDPQRDTADHLAKYVSFFHPDFIGLTYSPALGTEHIPLEKSLGIVSAIKPVPEDEAQYDFKGYGVSHGVMLYLINPAGQLQAILKPKINDHGIHFFETDTILKDYRGLRNYFG